MATIYKLSDIIPVSVGELVINLSPLSFEQKMQIQTEILKPGGQGSMRGAKLACQYAIKGISGIKDKDGNDYKISLENGKVSEDCWDDLQNIQETQKIIAACLNLINGIPKQFVDLNTGKPLEGVKFLEQESKEKKK